MATILFVDDDPLVLRITKRGLERSGHQVAAYAAGMGALEHQARPDVALLDIQMPGLDGPELGRRLRKRWPGLAIVFLTGGAEDGVMAQAEALGPVLEKPCKTSELVEVLKRVVRRLTPAVRVDNEVPESPG